MAEDTKSPIPEDIKQGIMQLSKSSKTPAKTIFEELKDIMANDSTVQSMEQVEFKIRYAYALLLNRYTSTGGAQQMYLRPLSIPRARKVKSQGTMKYVGNIYALLKIVEKDDEGNIIAGDLQYGAGTLWEKAAETAQSLSPNKVYKTSLRVTETAHGIDLGGNDATFVEVEDNSFPTVKEFFEKEIKPKIPDLSVKLGNLELNHREDATDIRIIRAMVIDVGTGETANNVEFGRYTITDDSMIGRVEGGPANYSMWVHPSEAEWDNGSELYFVGTVNHDEKAKITRFDCHFVIPTEVAIKRKIKPKAVEGKEEITMESLDAELDEEHKKTEEQIEDEFAL